MNSFLSRPKRVEVTDLGTGRPVVICSMSESGRKYVGDGVGTQIFIGKCCREGLEHNGFTFRKVDDYDDVLQKVVDWSRKPIFQIDSASGGIIKYFSSVSNAGRFGYENLDHNCPDADQVRKLISRCVNGHVKSSLGYKWRRVRHDEIVDDSGPIMIVVTPPG